jgi:hypothetical protein
MIEDPGSFAGITNSAKPARDPHDISRLSLAILWSETARVRSVPESCTSASWAPYTVNLFDALTKGRLVSIAISAAAASPNPGAALMPVQTAVPPSARLYTPFNTSKRSILSLSMPE